MLWYDSIFWLVYSLYDNENDFYSPCTYERHTTYRSLSPTDLKYAGKLLDINLASSLVKILFRLSFACIIYWRVVHYLQRSTSTDVEGVPGAAHDHELMVHRMNKILSFGIVKDPIVSYLILIYVTFLGNPAAE